MTATRTRIVANLHGNVHRRRGERIHVSREAGFLHRKRGRERREIGGNDAQAARRNRRSSEPAAADKLGGDALVHPALGPRVKRQRQVGVRLDVDESGRDNLASGVDHLSSLAGKDRLDCDDAVSAYRDIRP
jgi:hypothetical protein